MAVATRSIDDRGGGFALRWTLAVLLLVAFHALGVGLLVLLGYAGTLAIPPRPWLGAAIFVVPFLWPIVQGIVSSRREVDADAWVVGEEVEPRLWATVAALAERTGTAPPGRILLYPGASAQVTERPRLAGLRPGDRELRVGVGLFSACRVDELEAVLAHELAHFAGGDSRVDAVVSRTWGSIVTTVNRLDDAAASWIFVVYARVFASISSPVLRRGELRADAVAAAVVGPDAVARAVDAVQRADLAFEELEGRMRVLARAGRYPENLYEGLRVVLDDPEWQAGLDARAQDRAAMVDPLAIHPAASDRLARLGPPDRGQPAPADRRPARGLLDRAAEHEERASAVVGAAVASGGELTRLDWPAATTALWLAGRGRRADDVTVLADGSSEGEVRALLDVLEREGPESAASALGTDLGRWPSHQRSFVARGGVEAELVRLVGRVAVEHAHRVLLAWAPPDLFVDPAGRTVNVSAWAAEAVSVPETGIPALRAWLDELVERDDPASPRG